MGGGNGLKSYMAQQKHQAKKADERSGGGGAQGIKERTESKNGTVCAICRTPFTSVKMKAQLRDHWQSKHPRNTLAECFPNDSANLE